MKRLLPVLLAGCIASAYAQAPYTPTPPAGIPATMPAATLTLTAGASMTVHWSAVTQNNDGSTISAPVYYDIWQVSPNAAPVLIATGLTGTSFQVLNLAAGLDCYVVDASEQEPSGALPAYGESNASNATCDQVNAPVKVEIPYGPDNVTSSSP